MKIATSELEYLREEVKNCHHSIKDLQKKREWVGLTDEERDEILNIYITGKGRAQAIEAKLKEKNDGV